MVMLHFTVTRFYSRGSQPAASTAGFMPGQRCRLDVRGCLISVAFFLFWFRIFFSKVFGNSLVSQTYLQMHIAAILEQKIGVSSTITLLLETFKMFY